MAGTKEEQEEAGETFHQFECRVGRFSRSIKLPCAVEEEKVDARYHHGLLTVSVPKSEAAKPRQIEVKSTSSEGVNHVG